MSDAAPDPRLKQPTRRLAPRVGVETQRLTPFLTAAEIATTVGRLAERLRDDYQDRNPVVVGVLRGSFVFLADLVRAMAAPVEVDFTRASSYAGDRSTGAVRTDGGPETDLRDRDVLIVEDIVDTGRTTALLMAALRERGPASLRLCALLDKPSRREVAIEPDYVGLTIPDRFVVGYGLDHDQRWRHLPGLWVVEAGPSA